MIILIFTGLTESSNEMDNKHGKIALLYICALQYYSQYIGLYSTVNEENSTRNLLKCLQHLFNVRKTGPTVIPHSNIYTFTHFCELTMEEYCNNNVFIITDGQ